jgi:hypothetical protein
MGTILSAGRRPEAAAPRTCGTSSWLPLRIGQTSISWYKSYQKLSTGGPGTNEMSLIEPLRPFSEEYLSTMGIENVAMIEKPRLPGDFQCSPKSVLEPPRSSNMSLKRLLEKHPQLCHLKLLAFEVPLSGDAEAESWTSMESYGKFTSRFMEHLDVLHLSSR